MEGMDDIFATTSMLYSIHKAVNLSPPHRNITIDHQQPLIDLYNLFLLPVAPVEASLAGVGRVGCFMFCDLAQDFASAATARKNRYVVLTPRNIVKSLKMFSNKGRRKKKAVFVSGFVSRNSERDLIVLCIYMNEDMALFSLLFVLPLI